MLEPMDAISLILSHCEQLREGSPVRLSQAAGRVLAREVVSDLDMPPFRKSAMDGYALRRTDLVQAPQRPLERIGESRAGQPFVGAVPEGTCVEIYTGAEVPDDCDCVVMIERSSRDADQVLFDDAPSANQHICNKGEDMTVGQVVMHAGRRLSATDLSVLAAVGCDPVPVVQRPRVAILTTGDELVAPSQRPGVGQIREGNTLHLAALATRAGAEVECLGLVEDEQEELERRFGEALESSDAVITTGGVSMGRYDLVAQAFQTLGVQEIFHKIAIKPGKPLWFGKRGTTLVFGLPGNPVSCLLDHEVFVRPALAKMEGAEPPTQPLRLGRWDADPPRSNPRQQNLPVTVAQDAGGVDVLTPIRWNGSADIVGLASATAMAVIEPGETVEPGVLVPYRPLY